MSNLLRKYAVVAKLILADPLLKFHTGATHRNFNLEQSIAYIEEVFNDYFFYGGLSANDLSNKTILEIGPGDNFGIAMKFIAKGARQVVCLDRFLCQRDPKQERLIYEKLLEKMNSQEKQNVQAALMSGNGQGQWSFSPQKITYVHGRGIENVGDDLKRIQFDIIVSRAVLQYVDDLDSAFANMEALLKKGGVLIHKIDLRDHGLFGARGFDALEFLTVPDFLWNKLGSHAGKTNRRRIDYYRHKISELKFNSRIFITHVFSDRPDIKPHKENIHCGTDYSSRDLEKVAAIKPRLLKRFRNLSDEDLLVSGIFLIARK